jgi:hypothetical protein
MGATLPLIARWVESTPSAAAWWGYFYGSNIAGGVLGCFLAGFYLLRVYDMSIASYLAAGINLAIAIWRRSAILASGIGDLANWLSTGSRSPGRKPRIAPGKRPGTSTFRSASPG